MKKALKMPGGGATRNETVKSFASLSDTFGTYPKSSKVPARISGRNRYLKVLLQAAKSETAWTPHTVE